jgi:hypothetical protein
LDVTSLPQEIGKINYLLNFFKKLLTWMDNFIIFTWTQTQVQKTMFISGHPWSVPLGLSASGVVWNDSRIGSVAGGVRAGKKRKGGQRA